MSASYGLSALILAPTATVCNLRAGASPHLIRTTTIRRMGSSAASPQRAAPWRTAFLANINSMKQARFVLSTLHPEGGDGHSTNKINPRARSCMFRGMWASLPGNDKNDAPRNPGLYESDMPVFTTDVRMQKAPEIFASGPGEKSGQELGSGGGGPVEAVWWAEDAGVQWRVRGTAWVMAPDVDGDSDGARRVREEVMARMRQTTADGNEGAEDWSWAREVTAHFGSLTPAMRGTFKNPPPGTPREIPPGEGLEMGSKVTDLHDKIARANFRVVVIVPTEVDRVDLSNADDHRRWLYTWVGASGKAVHQGGEVIEGWEKVEVYP